MSYIEVLWKGPCSEARLTVDRHHIALLVRSESIEEEGLRGFEAATEVAVARVDANTDTQTLYKLADSAAGLADVFEQAARWCRQEAAEARRIIALHESAGTPEGRERPSDG